MRNHFLRAAAGNTSGGGSIVTTNLKQYYDFGNTACYNTSVSTTAVSDLSGNNTDAVFASAPTFSSLNGGFIKPTAAGQHLVKTTSAGRKTFVEAGLGNSDFTLEFWMKIEGNNVPTTIYADFPAELTFSPAFILGFHFMNIIVGSNRLKGKALEGSNGIYELNLGGGAGLPNPPDVDIDSSNVYAPSIYSLGWEHFVATRTSTSSNGMKFYRNNSLIATRTNSISYGAVPRPGFSLNGNQCQYFNSVNCQHAIMRVYIGYGFTATDVAQNYNAEKARFGLS